VKDASVEESSRGLRSRLLLLPNFFLINQIVFTYIVNVVRWLLRRIVVWSVAHSIEVYIVSPQTTTSFILHDFLQTLQLASVRWGWLQVWWLIEMLIVFFFGVLIIRVQNLISTNKSAHLWIKKCVGKFDWFAVTAIVLIHDITDISLHQFLAEPLGALLPFVIDAHNISVKPFSWVSRLVRHVSSGMELFGRRYATSTSMIWIVVGGDLFFTFLQMATIILTYNNQLLSLHPTRYIHLHHILLPLPFLERNVFISSLLNTSVDIYKVLRRSHMLPRLLLW